MACDCSDLKEDVPLDNTESTGNLVEPTDELTPLADTDAVVASSFLSVKTANEDRVDEMISDEH